MILDKNKYIFDLFYLLCPSNFRIIIPRNVFWGATWPLLTGMMTTIFKCAHKNPFSSPNVHKVTSVPRALCQIQRPMFRPRFVDVHSDTVVVVTRVSEPWLNSSNPTPGVIGREDDSGEIRVEKHRCPLADRVPWWCWTRTEDCVFIRL